MALDCKKAEVLIAHPLLVPVNHLILIWHPICIGIGTFALIHLKKFGWHK